MKLGFVGLGKMGKNMAVNLAIKHKDEVMAYDVSDACYRELSEIGANPVGNIHQIASADIIFLSLPNARVVENILTGDNGLLQKLSRGQVVADLSTISYDATVKLHDALMAKGVRFLDAPVSGMEARAKDGTLSVMCGGDYETFEYVRPYFEMIGSKILFMGGPGCGQLAKLINQLLFDINAAALAEILPMAVKLGLDPEKVGEIVNSGTGRSYASEFFIPRVLKGIFSQGYFMESAYKDLVSAAELSANNGIPLPVLGAATSTYQMALRRGLGGEDKGAMIKVYEELLGVVFRTGAQA